MGIFGKCFLETKFKGVLVEGGDKNSLSTSRRWLTHIDEETLWASSKLMGLGYTRRMR